MVSNHLRVQKAGNYSFCFDMWFFSSLAVSPKPIPNWGVDATDRTSNLPDTVRVTSANLHSGRASWQKVSAEKLTGNSLLQHLLAFHAGCSKLD